MVSRGRDPHVVSRGRDNLLLYKGKMDLLAPSFSRPRGPAAHVDVSGRQMAGVWTGLQEICPIQQWSSSSDVHSVCHLGHALLVYIYLTK